MTVFTVRTKQTVPKSLRRVKQSRPGATYTPVKYEQSALRKAAGPLSFVAGVASLVLMFLALTAAPEVASSGVANVGTIQLSVLLGLLGIAGISLPIVNHLRARRFRQIMDDHEEELAELGLSDEDLLEDFIEQQEAEIEALAQEMDSKLERADEPGMLCKLETAQELDY